MLRFIAYFIGLIFYIGINLNAAIYNIVPNGNDIFFKSLNVTGINTNEFILYNTIHPVERARDMSIEFDKVIEDITGNYNISYTKDIKNVQGANGGRGILLPHLNSYIKVEPYGSGFLRGVGLGSFTIEFYLKPYKSEMNAQVFSRMGVYTENGTNKFAGIKASIVEGRLVWEFKDFFKYGDKSLDLVLSQGEYLKIGEWTHHSISFDISTGKLVKYINGFEDEIVYVTTTGNRDGSSYIPYFSPKNANPMYIGGGFVGSIDSFNILLDYKRDYDLLKYNPSGEVISKVIDLKNENAFLETIRTFAINTNGTAINLYYRSSYEYFLPDNDTIEWTDVKDGMYLGYKKAKYIQVKAILESDGSRSNSPILNNIEIVYDIPPKPQTPINLTAIPADSAVVLKWEEAHNGNAVGYKIYYGTKSGIYNEFNDVPIVIGKQNEYVIDGLENGKLYYFNVRAFAKESDTLESDFAKEVYARPSSLP